MIKPTIKLLMVITLFSSLAVSCDKGSDTDTEKQTENPIPTKVKGTLPANGEPCSDFEIVPNDNSKVAILFKWNASQDAVNYDLIIMDGTQEAAKTTVGATEATLSLDKGKTYSWTVTAKNETGNTVSDTYSFTTPGQATGNYAPYAAEITLDFNTTNQTLNISWTAEDEDGDSLTFDIEILEDETLIQEESDLTTNFIDDIIYMNATLYSVKVISKDVSGNFSVSEKTITSPE
jgi:hypothetical protein